MSTDEKVLRILGVTRASLKTDLNGGHCGRSGQFDRDERGEYWMECERNED